MFSSCYHYFCSWNDDELDYDLCDSNTIVEITLQRDFLLFKLQELVDSTNTEDADKAIRAMDEATGSSADDQRLMRFLLRAGALSILDDVLQRDSKAGRPSLMAAQPLMAKLTQFEASAREATSSIWIK
jgi:hypothetical protein